jgi:hypothetical protein
MTKNIIDLTTGVQLDLFDNTSIGNIDLTNLSTTINAGMPLHTGTYTTAQLNGNYSLTASSVTPSVNLNKNGIELEENCDIKFGNTSLKTFMQTIEQRLAILQPNPRLEKDWEELKTLGDQYRELEKQINEKMKTWDILKHKDDIDSPI